MSIKTAVVYCALCIKNSTQKMRIGFTAVIECLQKVREVGEQGTRTLEVEWIREWLGRVVLSNEFFPMGRGVGGVGGARFRLVYQRWNGYGAEGATCGDSK